MTDPLPERIPRIVAENTNTSGVIDAEHIVLHLSHAYAGADPDDDTDTGYDPEDIRDAIDECVERDTIVKGDGGYRLPDA